MTTTETIDRPQWKRLAHEAPHRFEDEALDLLGWERRDDMPTTVMLGIVLEVSEEAAGRGEVERCQQLMQTYDVFLTYWQPVTALRQRLDSEFPRTGDWETVQSLVRVVLEQQDRIAALEARLS